MEDRAALAVTVAVAAVVGLLAYQLGRDHGEGAAYESATDRAENVFISGVCEGADAAIDYLAPLVREVPIDKSALLQVAKIRAVHAGIYRLTSSDDEAAAKVAVIDLHAEADEVGPDLYDKRPDLLGLRDVMNDPSLAEQAAPGPVAWVVAQEACKAGQAPSFVAEGPR